MLQPMLNPRATVFAPHIISRSTLNPQASSFLPRTAVPQSILDPRAASFIPVRAHSSEYSAVSRFPSGSPSELRNAQLPALLCSYNTYRNRADTANVQNEMQFPVPTTISTKHAKEDRSIRHRVVQKDEKGENQPSSLGSQQSDITATKDKGIARCLHNMKVFTKDADKASAEVSSSTMQLVSSSKRVVQKIVQYNKVVVRFAKSTCLRSRHKFSCKLAERLFVPLLLIGISIPARITLLAHYGSIQNKSISTTKAATPTKATVLSAVASYAGFELYLLAIFGKSNEIEGGGESEEILSDLGTVTDDQLMRNNNEGEENAYHQGQPFLTLPIRPKLNRALGNEGLEAMTIFDESGSEEDIDADLRDSGQYSLTETQQPALTRVTHKRFATCNESGFGPSAWQKFQDLLPKPATTSIEYVSAPSSKPFHHCTFWNGPSIYKSETDPAVSLAILTSSPKSFMAVSEFDHEAAKHIVAWNAHKMLDPVIYMGNLDVLRANTKSASERRDFAIGQVFQFYSHHGTWQYDTLSQEDPEPMLDYADMGHYPVDATVVNGYADDKGQPTQCSLDSGMTSAAEIAEQRRKDFKAERESSGFPNGFGPSPLWKTYTPESMSAEEVEEAAMLTAAGRKSENMLTCCFNELLQSAQDSDSYSESNYSQDEELLQQLNPDRTELSEAAECPGTVIAKDDVETLTITGHGVEGKTICTHIEESLLHYDSSSDTSNDRTSSYSGEFSSDDENEQISPISVHAIHQVSKRLMSGEQHTATKATSLDTPVSPSDESQRSSNSRAHSVCESQTSSYTSDACCSPAG